MADRLSDDLVTRIRRRAEDPETRTDTPPTARGRTVAVGPLSLVGVDLGALLRGEADVTSRLADDALPPVADASAAAAAEAALGFALPAPLRQLYAQVADGGFGPGAGLMSLTELVETYRNRLANAPGPRGQEWPMHLLPFTRTEPGHDCIDLDSGAIVVWDEEMLADGVSDKVWKRSFKRDAPNLDVWFTRWIETRSPAQATKDMMQESMLNGMRETLEHWRAKTPAERAEFGLPETGWEEVLFGHLGMDLSKL